MLEQNKTIEISEINNEIEKYKEDVLFMLEDDSVIDENERKILNRKIKKYGLTASEAINAEKEVISNLFSESELLYIEELKDIIEEGEITEIELKILDRYAKKFGINNEIQKKINGLFIK